MVFLKILSKNNWD